MRDLAYLLAQIHFNRPIDEWDQQDQTRTFIADAAAEAENHQALVFRDDLDRIDQDDDDQQDQTPDQT